MIGLIWRPISRIFPRSVIRTKVLVLGSCSWKSNGGLNPLQHAATQGNLAGLTIVEKVRGGKKQATA